MRGPVLQARRSVLLAAFSGALLAAGATGCTTRSDDHTTQAPPLPPSETSATHAPEREEAPMRITLTVGATVLKATLDDNPTTRDFLALLPLDLAFEDHNRTEKISYLPRKLSTASAPTGAAAAVGDISYYAPWGNLAIFYRDFPYSSGLVKLGRFDSDVARLAEQQGAFTVTVAHA
jgi:hypothetical protein